MKKEITREIVKQLRKDIDTALSAVGARYGMEIHAGSASFDSLTVDFKLSAKLAKSEGFDPDKEQWDKNCKFYNLSEDDYGKTFTINGTTYQICGLNTQARSYPVLIRNTLTGDVSKSTVDSVRMHLSSAPPVAANTSDQSAQDTSNTAAISNTDKLLWERRIVFTGLLPEDLGAKIRIGAKTYTITGFNPRATKNKVLLDYMGNAYSASIDMVLEALGRNP